jgi:hypothetical protein
VRRAGKIAPETVAVATVLALAFGLRLAAALQRPLYVDEGLSLSIASMPVGQELQFLRSDFHPPMFFLLLHALETVRAPIWCIRTIVAALGAVSVGLLMVLVRQWSTAVAAIAAGACTAVMPALVFYDGWLRMYAPLDTLGLASACLLSSLATKTMRRSTVWLTWTAWVAAVAAGLYTHYLAWMELCAQVLFAATRSRAFFLQAAVAGAIAALLWVPQAPTFAHQLGAGGVSFGWFQTHLAEGLWELPSQSTVDPLFEGWQTWLVAGLVWLWLLASLILAWPSMKSTMLPWLAVPALITIVSSLAAHKYLYDGRYYLSLDYALAAWTGMALQAYVRRRTVAVTAAVVLGLALAAPAAAYAFDPAYYTSDWPRAAAIVSGYGKPGDLLIFEPGAGDWAFKYYADQQSYRLWTVSTQSEIDRAVKLVDRERRVWLIGSGIVGVDPQLRLLTELQKHFRLAHFEESTRALPSQDLQVGLFVRSR